MTSILMALVFLAGCATITRNTAKLDDIKRIRQPQFPKYVPPKPQEGSLWSEFRGVTLYPDKRARKVGDVVVVRIVEDPEAKLDANTKTSRSSSVEAAKLKFFGVMQRLADEYPRLAQNPGVDDLMLASLGLKFDGKGTSDRTGHVKAYISAVVVNVLPNGNLYINGKREIKVNNETQYMTLAGIIRPEDISPKNWISSTYVADARIAYSGVGPVSDKQRTGFIGRFVDYVWPF